MIRLADVEREREPLLRIFTEVGWLPEPEIRTPIVLQVLELSRVLVWDVKGTPEGLAASAPAEMCYLGRMMPIANIEFVAVSRVARQGGVAARLTAESIARDVLERAMPVNTLGMFDQGFYERVGFGTGSPQLFLRIDPADFDVPPLRRPVVRLGTDDWERMHACRRARRHPHGTITMLDPRFTRAGALGHDLRNYFGLGFEDPATGELTHFLWIRAEATGPGPYEIRWMAWRTREHLLDLLGLLRSLSDQVMLVIIPQPGGMQMQDLIRRPFRNRSRSRAGALQATYEHLAWWQIRINDVAACLSWTRLPWVSTPFTFELELTDPVERFLSEETRSRWSGVGGRYLVTLGPESYAERLPSDAPEGHTGRPRLRTSVNTFSRLWLGVLPPSGLALTAPDLGPGFADPGLIEALDEVLRLPTPQVDWPL